MIHTKPMSLIYATIPINCFVIKNKKDLFSKIYKNALFTFKIIFISVSNLFLFYD